MTMRQADLQAGVGVGVIGMVVAEARGAARVLHVAALIAGKLGDPSCLVHVGVQPDVRCGCAGCPVSCSTHQGPESMGHLPALA